AQEGGASVTAPRREGASGTVKKLSYNEQRELDGLPARIDALEKEIAALERDLVEGKIYTSERLAPAQEELERLVERWAELEERRM
ncbi:MAG: ABC transporter ATP-binding protein, partial [bacterium]|nr:ABC transporter ATP-binding protein [Candidatus Colisoma equi]